MQQVEATSNRTTTSRATAQQIDPLETQEIIETKESLPILDRTVTDEPN
jgi:hypothetical protein